MRTVLIPTDFSNNAMHAITYALRLFKCERTNFYFLHAYADEVYGPFKKNNGSSIEGQKKTIQRNVDTSLSELVDKLKEKEHNPKHAYETVSSFESLVDAVNDFANQINVDLVIMGTQGQTGNKKITFGSHTVQVFKYVQCPVLAIPEDYVYEQPKKILFPTDYMLPYKRRELKLLNTLAAEFKSEVHCLYISDFEDLSYRQIDNKRFLQEELSDAYLYFEMTPVKNKTAAITEYISQKDIDMLVMVNSRHSFLEDMLYRSTVDEIGLHPRIPFLVMQKFTSIILNMPNEKILLPTDFSNNAWNAIVYALEFFKTENCTFHILHTYTPTFYRLDYMMGGPTFSAIPDLGVDIAQAGLDKTLIDIKKNFDNPKHTYKTLSAFNTLTNEIIELTESKDYDLVIMGTQGATGTKEIFLGSHTVNVIRKSSIPVIAIPNDYHYKTIKSVVFPTDYKSLYHKKDLQSLIGLIKVHKTKLRVLHVKEEYDLTEGQEMNKKALATYFSDVDHIFVEERGKLMPEAVHEYCIVQEAGLLAMINRKHSFMERWLYKQNVDSIGFHTTVPFLVMRAHSDFKS